MHPQIDPQPINHFRDATEIVDSPLPDPAIALPPQNPRQPSRGRFDAFFAPFRLEEMEQLMHERIKSLTLALPGIDLDHVDAMEGLPEGSLPPELALHNSDATGDVIAIRHDAGHTRHNE